MRKFLILALVPLLLAGCALPGWGPNKEPPTPTDNLMVATTAYTNLVQALGAIRASGGFTTTQAAEVKLYIELGRYELDQWKAAIDVGKATGQPVDTTQIVAEFQQTLMKMQTARIAAERKAVQ